MTFSESRLLLVDGHAYAYRSFHAIRSLTSLGGEPTNAIFGFIKAMRKLMADLAPSHVGVVWDGGLAAERTALLPQYKAQRPPMPPDLVRQMDGLGEWLGASGLASLRREGVEADDWIATLAVRFRELGASVVIATSDKDFLQLVSESVRILNPNDKGGGLCGPADVEARTGVRPDQIVDWLSLVGDSVDNIPGVPGVGPKTAAGLLQRFGSWDALTLRLGEVESDRLRGALERAGEIVARNRRMIRLRTDLDPGVAWEGLGRRSADMGRLATLYRRWGFRSFEAEVSGPEPAQGTFW
ncbi:MAG TPA: 5'-3' exonuclease H3TH domain-containing protein [Verrucomicrobiota bacterium]|nr:5'-3' exonuclease H3TH domain-containing protein [Verrucomicrobiota bacterium]HNU50060.1 5'-3' exonuclease H3TH domain-containing protein [Verrucomicrobiota bacterium]